MKKAFKHLAEGQFTDGLAKLGMEDSWHDESQSLDGPFYLGFPGVCGWGEGLFVSSLLKRYAAATGTPTNVFASPPVHSIVKHDRAFECQPSEGIKGRPPLAVLREALLGSLLALPFQAIDTGDENGKSSRTRPKVGVAWASLSDSGPIPWKSVPLADFLEIFGSLDVECISFQRRLEDSDRAMLQERFGSSCSIVPDLQLHAGDQSDIVREIRDLDCMLTISTTTAHIAACLGVPVVLLAANRAGFQWFWRAQAEHNQCFYPHVDIVLGSSAQSDWWRGCLEPAERLLADRLEASS